MTSVLYQAQGEVCYITLNRPDAMNAIDQEMHDNLLRAWQDFAADEALRVAIVTGAGEAFCAGADLKTLVPVWHDGDALLPRNKIRDGLGGITRGLHRIAKPIIAAVNGWALAAGFELALAADLRIASEQAQFGSFEVRRGFHHADGGIVRLINICGVGIAYEMLLTGEAIDANRAKDYHIVSRVVPHGDLLASAEDLAAKVLRNDRFAVESAKETILSVIGRPLDDQLAIEAVMGYSAFANPAAQERLEQFYAKTDQGRVGRNATSR